MRFPTTSLEYSMIVKLLTEHHLEFLSLKGGCRGSSESTIVQLLDIPCHGSFGKPMPIRTTSNELLSSIRYKFECVYSDDSN